VKVKINYDLFGLMRKKRWKRIKKEEIIKKW